MLKKILSAIILLGFLNSCISSLNEERIKSAESLSASQRINNSEMNNRAVFDEME